MKTNYFAPLTEIVIINADNYLEDSQDSTGTITGDDPHVTANEFNFDESESKSNVNIWDD